VLAQVNRVRAVTRPGRCPPIAPTRVSSRLGLSRPVAFAAAETLPDQQL